MGLALTELDDAFRRDPHGVFRRLRDEAPVHWDAQFGHFFLTRYGHVREILTDVSLWRDPDKAEEGASYARSRIGSSGRRDRWIGRIAGMLQLDDPDHARVRGVLAQALYSRVARSGPLIEGMVRQRLATLEGRSVIDIVRDYTTPLPVDVIATILGAESQDLATIRRWAEALIKIFHPARTPAILVEIAAARRDFAAYLEAKIQARREAPADDLISDLIGLMRDGADLTEAELRANCQALLVAGSLTTTDLIGNAIWLLLSHPSELEKLRGNPGLVGNAVDEALRCESPVDITVRIASRDMTLNGCPIREGQALTVSLRAANRDPEVFNEPDQFNITAARRPHVAFGGGAHICVGQPLARVEAKLAISVLLDRYPRLALADPVSAPEWREMPFFHGLRRCDVLTGE